MFRCAHIVSWIFTFLSFLSFAQDEYVVFSPRDYVKNPAKTAGYLELGGNAGLYSLNIERIYHYREKIKLSVRIGFAPHFNGIYIEQIYITENNFIFLKNPHHVEIGLGGTMQRRFNELPGKPDRYVWENIVFGVGRAGYRYQKQDDGFFFRAAITPVITSRDALGFHSNYFQFWAGLCLGLSF
ncbi:MAG: hypothetical protein K0R26_293 [Bacteroidota bacterium]|nr:hypothetical protein [Bacteroidota bacterium]